MVAPAFAFEGARIGGVTADGISMVARTDSAGARLYCDVYADPGRTRLVASSPAATLNAGNNFQATTRVTGLTPGRRYYWRARADDGSSGSTVGDDATYSQGAFRTWPAAGSDASWRLGFYACDPMNPTSGFNIAKSPMMWDRMRLQRWDQMLCLGDHYYSDIGTGNATADYTRGAWRNPGTTDASATLAAYRTDIIAAYDEFGRRGFDNTKARLFNHTPLSVGWDDHDRGWDDMSGQATWSAGQITRAAAAQQAGHEAFMGLAAPYIQAEGRPWVHGSTQEDYHCIDVASARVIAINCRAFRDLKSATDTPSKTMLGAAQKAWLLDKIANNPQRYLILASPLMLDGYHGWSESTNDGWVGCSYERDEVLAAIRASGRGSRTLIVSGDTHGGAVCRWPGAPDLYEVTAGNCWPDSYHGYINGFGAGASGNGAELLLMRVNEPNCLTIDLTPASMTVRLVETLTGRTAWSRAYV